MSSLDLENMFDLNRFHNQQDCHKVLLYFPFGFLFLVLRLAIGVLTLPLLALLPPASKQRSCILKGICLAFGVNVKAYIHDRDEKAKLLICNHISILDHLVVETTMPCKQVNMCSHFSEWNFPALYSSRHHHGRTLDLYSSSEFSLCAFPESTTTNGKHGLLKFDVLPFDTALPVQPVVIHISSTSFISISPSVMGSSSWCDLLWLLFVPYTKFSVRVLPSMIKQENESAENFSKRVQAVMATHLRVLATDFTPIDKAEYKKRLAAGTIAMNRISHPPFNPVGTELSKMATQVREILPDVPMAVILQDLGVTKSVDDTILRILEGRAGYIFEEFHSVNSSDKQLGHPSSSSNSGCNLQKHSILSLNTGVKQFGKTPKDRMQSYQERKAVLMKAAKLRYLKKHGLTS